MVAPHGGSPSTYFAIGSLSLSLPWRCSIRIASAVNCLDTDALAKRGVVVSGAFVARSARPPAPAQTTRPCLATAAEHPGWAAFTKVVTARSLFAVLAARVARAASRARVGATGRWAAALAGAGARTRATTT